MGRNIVSVKTLMIVLTFVLSFATFMAKAWFDNFNAVANKVDVAKSTNDVQDQILREMTKHLDSIDTKIDRLLEISGHRSYRDR